MQRKIQRKNFRKMDLKDIREQNIFAISGKDSKIRFSASCTAPDGGGGGGGGGGDGGGYSLPQK